MNVELVDALLALLNGDSTLQGYLGGTSRVLLGWVNQDTVFPCITLYEAGEASYPRVTYNQSKHRDCFAGIQIDCWVDKNHEGFPCTSRDLNVIADRVDELIFGSSISGINGWIRTSSIEMQENTTATRLFHKARRYECTYSVED